MFSIVHEEPSKKPNAAKKKSVFAVKRRLAYVQKKRCKNERLAKRPKSYARRTRSGCAARRKSAKRDGEEWRPSCRELEARAAVRARAN